MADKAVYVSGINVNPLIVSAGGTTGKQQENGKRVFQHDRLLSKYNPFPITFLTHRNFITDYA
jgi:hypothetical protein